MNTNGTGFYTCKKCH